MAALSATTTTLPVGGSISYLPTRVGGPPGAVWGLVIAEATAWATSLLGLF